MFQSSRYQFQNGSSGETPLAPLYQNTRSPFFSSSSKRLTRTGFSKPGYLISKYWQTWPVQFMILVASTDASLRSFGFTGVGSM